MIAMYYWRMDNGLEPSAPEENLPVFPLFSNCPETIEEDFIDVEGLIAIGINAVSDLEKMGTFLEDVAKWIRARPSTGTANFSLTGHGFAAEDNEECMKTFRNVEQAYLDKLDLG